MFKKAAGLMMALVLVLSIVTGCGAKMDKSSTQSTPPQAAEDRGGGYAGEAEKPNSKVEFSEEQNMESSDSDVLGITASSITGQTAANIILSQRKVIRNASLAIEVENFNSAYGKVNSLIAPFGYIQESRISKEKVRVNSEIKHITTGIIVLRVDKDRFDSILNDIQGIGDVMDYSISSDDVTDKFFDTESRLRLLRYEESRLEEYLNKISDPDTIFKTQSRLTDIRHEIESLTGTLNKWNNMVQLSTITIEMREKLPEGIDDPKVKSYMQRLSESFMESVKGIIVFCGDLLILLVQALPVLVILGLFAYILYLIYRKFSGKGFKGATLEDRDENKNL